MRQIGILDKREVRGPNGIKIVSYRPIATIDIKCKNKGKFKSVPTPVIIDTGSDVSMMPHDIALQSGVVGFDMSSELVTQPNSLGTVWVGRWGSFQISSTAFEAVLPCFFYTRRRASAPRSIMAWIGVTKKSPTYEDKFSHTILGAAGFLGLNHSLLICKSKIIKISQLKLDDCYPII
jgi:hypothetical protein